MVASAGVETSGNQRKLPAGRKAELAAVVFDVGQVTVAELAERFDVSLDTIRRDLDQLDADGVLIRTRGGAMSPSALPRPDTGLDVRRRVQTSAKEAIGTLAATLVQDGSSLMINGGTTALAVVRNLRDHRDLTIATNNLLVPSEINPSAVRDLYIFGGTVRISAQATVGPVVFRNGVSGAEVDVQCDLALIAVGAASVSGGYSTSNLAEAAMMFEMMERASRVAVLVDSSKFSKRLFAQVADLSRADYLVTDQEPPTDLLEALRHHDVELLVPGRDSTAAPVRSLKA
ncbi:DeoR/GlpR family DNA-binding transcription regulator [Georgenia sp. AZ-5]|uniref:DeoR/GlpR family DNA-binding transcription regulator n=1 Tax=Georgenia sp. AZ-5 TaxID=3367526 RepID=UPI0037546748